MGWRLEKFVAGLLYDLDDPMSVNFHVVDGVIAATPLLGMALLVLIVRVWWYWHYGV